MKLSFSLRSKSIVAAAAAHPNPNYNANPAKAFDDDGTEDASAAKPEYITEFVVSKPLAPDAPSKHVIQPIPNDLLIPNPPSSKRVIPPIPNALFLRPTKKMKNLALSASPETRFVLDTSSAATAAAIPYGLTIRSSAAPCRAEVNGHRPSAEDLILRQYKEDMETLPDDRGFQEFDDIAVEDFATALLAGYGWSEGKGIGRNAKQDTKVFEISRHVGKAGIGYNPNAPEHIGLKGKVVARSKDGRRDSCKEERKSRDSSQSGGSRTTSG